MPFAFQAESDAFSVFSLSRYVPHDASTILYELGHEGPKVSRRDQRVLISVPLSFAFVKSW